MLNLEPLFCFFPFEPAHRGLRWPGLSTRSTYEHFVTMSQGVGSSAIRRRRVVAQFALGFGRRDIYNMTVNCMRTRGFSFFADFSRPFRPVTRRSPRRRAKQHGRRTRRAAPRRCQRSRVVRDRLWPWFNCRASSMSKCRLASDPCGWRWKRRRCECRCAATVADGTLIRARLFGSSEGKIDFGSETVAPRMNERRGHFDARSARPLMS